MQMFMTITMQYFATTEPNIFITTSPGIKLLVILKLCSLGAGQKFVLSCNNKYVDFSKQTKLHEIIGWSNYAILPVK